MPVFKRSKEKVFENIVTKDGVVYTKKPCKIQIPQRFTERAVGLGLIGVDTQIAGLFPLIMETGEYSVMNMCGMVQIDPYKITEITIEDVDYHEFYFAAGQVLFKTLEIVVNVDMVWNILNELVFKGKVPWYMDYEDLGNIANTTKKHAGSDVGAVRSMFEAMISIIARSLSDRKTYLRTEIKEGGKITRDMIQIVPLRSVIDSVNNTQAKITGNYLGPALVSALVDPSVKASKSEKILRA